VVSARVLVGKHRVKVIRGRRLRARVDLRGLPNRRVTVRIVVRTVRGRVLHDRRTYRTRTPRRRFADRSMPALWPRTAGSRRLPGG